MPLIQRTRLTVKSMLPASGPPVAPATIRGTAQPCPEFITVQATPAQCPVPSVPCQACPQIHHADNTASVLLPVDGAGLGDRNARMVADAVQQP